MSNLNKAIMENFANNNANNGNNGWKKNNMGYNGNPKVDNNNATNNGEQLTAANTVSGFGPFNWVKENRRTCAYAAGATLVLGGLGYVGYKAYKAFKKKSKKSEEKPQEAAANDAKGK